MADPQDPNYYLGRIYDRAAGKVTDQNLMFDPTTLTTHAVVTGMTGSGKTGLCISLLEEAALHGVPSVIIDPKGDLTNLVLHFPDLLPSDFEPWVDPDTARRSGKTVATLAAETAESWKKGLESYGLGKPELLQLKNDSRYAIYTPGSSAGLPISILASFQSPGVDWNTNRELLREKISTIVTALLGLIGIADIDPLRSREHILLSNIIESAWSSGHPLDLTELILQTQNPPFERLGAFPLDSFYPEKDRMQLAMLLNNFLASPSFQSWLEGAPLDIGNLLYDASGKPRQNIFYMAHLADNERMFFTTLLFAAVESWMRTQRGTSGLRALVYFDEIMGYLPPIANPPSKAIMLRMLKQARAFGVGLVLATQNPVDLDYKALSNAGTWMIGRLQTDQDKARLLDGLQNAGGTMDLGEYDKILSGLGKRVFLYHSVHRSGPTLFGTRWALNYLAGPLTRTQIPDLNRLAGVGAAAAAVQPAKQAASGAAGVAAAPAAAQVAASTNGYSLTRPATPGTLPEYFIPADFSLSQSAAMQGLPQNTPLQSTGLVYKPSLLAQAEVRYLARKYNVETSRHIACLLTVINSNLVRWEQFLWPAYQQNYLLSQPLPQTRFAPLPTWMSDVKRLKEMENDFEDWVYRSGAIRLQANETLKIYAGPEVSTADFRQKCSEAARAELQKAQDKIEATYRAKLNTFQTKITRQESEVKQQENEVNQRRLEEAGAGGELLLSLFSKRKKSISSNLTKRRLTAQAEADLDEAKKVLKTLQTQMADLQADMKRDMAAAQEEWGRVASEVSEIPLTPAKKDIFPEFFGVAWLPYYIVPVNGQNVEIPAFPPAPK